MEEVGMSNKEFLDDFWLNGDEPGDHSNRYNSITMILPALTDRTKQRFEEYICNNLKDAAMYGDIVQYPQGGYACINFDIHKGTYYDAVDLSSAFPEAVVVVDCGWDDYYLEVLRNGRAYDGYFASWMQDCEPTPYIEAGEQRYDCDVKIDVKLPWADKTVRMYAGGGMLEKRDFEYFKSIIDGHSLDAGQEIRR